MGRTRKGTLSSTKDRKLNAKRRSANAENDRTVEQNISQNENRGIAGCDFY